MKVDSGRGKNNVVEAISEIEMKLFEVIKQGSPGEYGGVIAIEAIKLLLNRLSGMSVNEG